MMTDKEITEIIATRVMGYVTNGNCDLELFNPLKDDSHCMMAWDEFSNGRDVSLTSQWLASGKKTWKAWHGLSGAVEDENRRRAMCECMVRAVV